MQRTEFLKLIGKKLEGTEYIPVACLLQNGYACAGFIHPTTAEQFAEVALLVNAQMIDLREPVRKNERGAIHDFSDFLEEFVLGVIEKKPKSGKKKAAPVDEYSEDEEESFRSRFGKRIPLTAIAYDQIAVVYPIGRIGDLIQQVNAETKGDEKKVPSFLDFENSSVVVKVLKTKLW